MDLEITCLKDKINKINNLIKLTKSYSNFLQNLLVLKKIHFSHFVLIFSKKVLLFLSVAQTFN